MDRIKRGLDDGKELSMQYNTKLLVRLLKNYLAQEMKRPVGARREEIIKRCEFLLSDLAGKGE